MRGISSVLALALLGQAMPSRADDGLPLDLTWSAPPECASAQDIERELARIARVRAGRSVARLSASGRIERVGASYRLSLRTEQNGVTGERSLVASECRSLEREVTLVLALAFGEGVELVNPEPSRATQAATEAANTDAPPPAARPSALAAPPPAEASPGTSTASGANRARIAGLLGAGVSFATLPSAAPLIIAGAELGERRLWLEPRVAWIPGVDQSLARGVSARYSGYGGGLAGCLELPPYSVGWNACIGGEALALRGRARGPIESVSAVAPLVNALAALGWEWPARGIVGLRFDAALHVALDEPRFVVMGLGSAHRVPRLTANLALSAVFGERR